MLTLLEIKIIAIVKIIINAIAPYSNILQTCSISCSFSILTSIKCNVTASNSSYNGATSSIAICCALRLNAWSVVAPILITSASFSKYASNAFSISL